MAGRRTVWRLANLGTALYRAEQYEKAVERLDESRAVNAAWEPAWNCSILAMAHHRPGHVDPARQNLDRAAAALEQRTETMFRYNTPGFLPNAWWDILQSTQHFREAVMLIDGKPPPDDPRQWVIRGRALAVLGRQVDAAASFTKAIEMNFTPASFERASVYRKLRLWDKAIADYAQAVLVPEARPQLSRGCWLPARTNSVMPTDRRPPARGSRGRASEERTGIRSGLRLPAPGIPRRPSGLLKSAELRQGGDSHDWFSGHSHRR